MNQRAMIEDMYRAVLFEYIAGALDEAQNFAVRAHVGLSPRARAFMHHYDAVGAAMIEEYCQPVRMSSGALNHVLAQLDNAIEDAIEKEREQERQRRAQAEKKAKCAMLKQLGLPPAIVSLMEAQGLSLQNWQEQKQGVRRVEVPIQCRHSRTRFVRLAPGVETPKPQRRNANFEMTVVLDGQYEDESGVYNAGDLVIVERTRKAYHAYSRGADGCTVLSVRSSGEGAESLLKKLLGL